MYCVSVVNFKNKVLTNLKMRRSAVVPRLLLVTVLGSFLLSIPIIWNVQQPGLITGNVSGNSSEHGKVKYGLNTQYARISIIFQCVLPIIIAITSIGFTLASLLGHVRRMKLSSSLSSAPHLETHYRACRTMILLVILYITFNAVKIIASNSEKSTGDVRTTVFWFLIMLYPSEQSVILISGSSKLTMAFLRIAQYFKK
ncbi:taste receptor type 2 member 7-like [Discoglossus pictus]